MDVLSENLVQHDQILIELVDRLSGCRDSRCIFRKAAHVFAREFSPFEIFGVIVSDPEMTTWRVLPLENPYQPVNCGLVMTELDRECDTDTLVEKHGRDLTLEMYRNRELQILLADNVQTVGLVRSESPQVLDCFSRVFGCPVNSAMGASWKRPLGGRGWMFLATDSYIDYSEELLHRLESAVRIVIRMGLYPSLLQSVKKQEQINASLRKNVVHDLKTPLTVIRGYASTIMNLCPEIADHPEMKEMLEGIVEQSDRLLLDLKDVLEPIHEKWVPAKDHFDLSLMLHKVVVAENHTDRSKNHRVVLTGDSSPIPYVGDSRKLRRTLENLLSNAVKYSPGLNKVVEIEIHQCENEVRVSFKDQGIGMTKDQLNRVLSSGGRVVDPALNIEGTGLGIDSCRQILEAHGGQLTAESEIGKGTTFTAHLPKNCC